MNYDKNLNYIGSSENQKKYTNLIFSKYSGINRTAYNHDRFYNLMLQEEYLFFAIILKLFFDLIFIIMGILRSLKRFELFGIPIAFIFGIILIITTPYYLKLNYKN